MSLLAALLVFSAMILFHEFGHFLLAKRGGICVVEFSLGMGPKLFSFVKGGTRYCLKLFPFGGSCMMLGEDEDLSGEEELSEDEDELLDGETDEPVSRESGILSDGEIEELSGQEKGTSDEEEDDVPRYMGIEIPPGATGLPFHETSAWTRFKVIAAGPLFNFVLAFLGAFFIISFAGYEPPIVHNVMEGYPAQEAGILPGDRITELNGKSIKIYGDITSYTGFHPGETLEVVYEREGEEYSTVLVPRMDEETGRYLMGIQYGGAQKSESVFTTIQYSFYELRYWVNMTLDSLKMVVNRQVSSDDIAGPVKIVSMLDTTVKETRQYGMLVVILNVTNMCVLLSVNLAIMNLLPLPALDGGRLVFIVIEMLRGKPVKQELEGRVHMIGMAMLMTLMMFILFNDIRSLF